jgi:filamentous hemagglutinin
MVSVADRTADIARRLEELGEGIPRSAPTPKGARQFIFPNGTILRFDLSPGQYSLRQGPHINLELSSGRNHHISLQDIE